MQATGLSRRQVYYLRSGERGLSFVRLRALLEATANVQVSAPFKYIKWQRVL
jgi:hypothetical protein